MYSKIFNFMSYKKEKPLLILDLDETLIHTYHFDETIIKFYYRPGLIHFLDIISKYYHIVIFTAAQPQYADSILNKIESNKKYFLKNFIDIICQIILI